MSDPRGDEVVDERQYEDRRISFGAAGGGQVSAQEYDAVRPDWPPSTLAWLVGESSSPGQGPSGAAPERSGEAHAPDPRSGSLVVVDVGAGTGKGSRALAGMGHRVVAVEPSAGMRAALTASLGPLPAEVSGRVEVRDGGAEQLPVDDRSVDAVVALQAWHWFDQEAAGAEAARALRRDGLLGLAWHQRDESPAWAAEVSRVVQRTAHLDSAEEEDAYRPKLTPDFAPAETLLVRWSMRQSVDDFVRHAGTWSFVAIAPDRDPMLAEIRRIALAAAGPDGELEIPMNTRCYRAQRR